jgi:hypothetical protein
MSLLNLVARNPIPETWADGYAELPASSAPETIAAFVAEMEEGERIVIEKPRQQMVRAWIERPKPRG